MDRATQEWPPSLSWVCIHIAVPPQGQSPQKRVFSPGLSSLGSLSLDLKAEWGPLTPHEPDTNSQSFPKSDEKLP